MTLKQVVLYDNVTSGWDLPSTNDPDPEPEEPIESTEEEQE